MKTKLKNVYYCEYCKKKGLSAFHMVVHEIWCSKNPSNTNKCSGCVFLQDEPIDVYYDVNMGGEIGEIKRTSKGYRCTLKDQKMHPLLAKKKKLPEKYPETFEGSILFPKECESAKYY